ncbi:MAG: hypothetical protein JXR37_11245 [Kiritimatiellae bacterium]|nr:hypothetical protein [Kiritimatiellia bacterium]
MTSRERLLAVLSGEIPDCVPVCPDISNMVPARLTGKPFWDIYVYKNPPLWKAHIDALKHFDIDGGFEICGIGTPHDSNGRNGHRDCIVHRYADDRFVTQTFSEDTGEWSRFVRVHTADNPPASNVLPEKIGLPAVPSIWEEIEGVREWPTGLELWQRVREEMGDQGIVGMHSGATTCMLNRPEDIYDYYDHPEKYHERRERRIEHVERSMEKIAQLDVKPDVLFCGGSGSLIWQSPQIFRDLALPVLKRVTELAHDLGIPTHVHSCGPEQELVRMAAEETLLTVIDPLEIPPMGDCNLAQLKARYGHKLVLKGNLHTTQVMLKGAVDDVIGASKQAIDDAAAGGGFILSTGDQCGRDTPDDNLHAMVHTARTYGRY